MTVDTHSVPASVRAPHASGTVVLGLGNPVLSDDALGLHVATALDQLLRAEPVAGVRVVTSTRAGFELIDLLSGADRAVIVDCLEVPRPLPGRLQRLDLEHVSGVARLVGTHDLSISAVFQLAEAMGIPMPNTVEIYGVEGGEIRVFSERLTPEVESAVDTLARDLHARFKQEARCSSRAPLRPPDPNGHQPG